MDALRESNGATVGAGETPINPPFLSVDRDACPEGSTQVTQADCLAMGRRAVAKWNPSGLYDYCLVNVCWETLTTGSFGYVPSGATPHHYTYMYCNEPVGAYQAMNMAMKMDFAG